MKNNSEEIIYSINVSDLHEVSSEVLERRLTKKEVALIRSSVGNYIDWFQAIENAINEHIPAFSSAKKEKKPKKM